MAELTVLAQTLGEQLQNTQSQLALAESCTGGMVAAAVTSISGSSAWFDRGFVTYSNQAKQDMLDVPALTLESFGAVSEQTAEAMARGALNHSRASIAGAITGIAGPTGGSAEKPVGMVCFGIAKLNAQTQETDCVATTQFFYGDRQTIREQATIHLLTQLIATLKNEIYKTV